MPSPKWFKFGAVVAVMAVVGLLVYRAEAYREFIPSEKREQYSQDLTDGVRLVQRQTSDMQDGFSQTFATLRPQVSANASVVPAPQGQVNVAAPAPTVVPSYLHSIQELRDAWTPRYRKVSSDYSRFLSRVEDARQKALLYFDNQAYLTSTLIDGDLRTSYKLRDEEELSAFRAWEARVDEIAASASAMMNDFRDMDTVIQKQVMSARFAELSEEFFVEVPQSLMQLNEDLEQFRRQSELLYGVFGDSVTNMFRDGP